MWIHSVNHDFKSIAFPKRISEFRTKVMSTFFWPLMHNVCSHCPNPRASPIFLRSIFPILAKSIPSTSCDKTQLMPVYRGIMMQAHVNVDSEDATWRDNSNLVMINNRCLYTIQRWTFTQKINFDYRYQYLFYWAKPPSHQG